MKHNIPMAYTHQEDFGGAMEDRQLSILTTVNIAGAFIGAVVVWQLLGLLGVSLPWLVHYGLMLILGGGTGIGLTLRWNGLSLLDSLMLWSGWRMRLLLRQTTVHPQAALVALDDGDGLVLYDEEEVLVRPYDPQTAKEAVTYGG